MASLTSTPASLGTMGGIHNSMAGVSSPDPLAQTYSGLTPYTAGFNSPYNPLMLQLPRQQQKEGYYDNFVKVLWIDE